MRTTVLTSCAACGHLWAADHVQLGLLRRRAVCIVCDQRIQELDRVAERALARLGADLAAAEDSHQALVEATALQVWTADELQRLVSMVHRPAVNDTVSDPVAPGGHPSFPGGSLAGPGGVDATRAGQDIQANEAEEDR